ncbi:MAG: hypothetical protein ACFFD4_24245 [Candidatus Odinarchaeota archaeon]
MIGLAACIREHGHVSDYTSTTSEMVDSTYHLNTAPGIMKLVQIDHADISTELLFPSYQFDPNYRELFSRQVPGFTDFTAVVDSFSGTILNLDPSWVYVSKFIIDTLESYKDMVAAETVCSSNEDYIITGKEAERFIQLLENPDPERVKIRQQTLQKALETYRKHKKLSNK